MDRNENRRVVVTGLGIVSSLGNGVGRVLRSLQDSHSGVVFMPEMKELGYKCCVAAPVEKPDTAGLPRKRLRTMSTAAFYGVAAALEAIADAGLPDDAFQSETAGVVVGTGAGGVSEVPRAEQLLAQGKSCRELGSAGFVRIMNSTATANLAVLLGAKGRTCSLSAACAGGLYNIGHAYELVRHGLCDLCLSGAAEEETWKQVGLSADNGDGMPIDWNDRPEQACRPFDRDRQGFVSSAGAGVVVLESLQRAERRGAKVFAEVVGYGAANDAHDMFVPSGDGLRRSILEAIGSASEAGVKRIDYINPHGPGTLAGDRVDVEAIRGIFGENGDGPLVSSTKGLGGHAQGAAGAIEVIHTLLMLRHGFVAPTANLENVAPDCRGIRHVQTLQERRLATAITFNTGLGGVNACLVLRKL